MSGRVANSTLQDRSSSTPQFQPDPLPPRTKIIECSCNEAQSRLPDNSEWTNILNEPITVKKGSEIRVQQSAIDMTGIDSDIIQFQSSGIDQDNSHTLLCQHYTVNDGTNGKTTTYDYMGARFSGDCGMTPHDPGQDYTGTLVPYQPTLSTITGTGTGFQQIIAVIKPHAIRPRNIGITTNGEGYDNGATFKILTSDPTDSFEGYIQTNDTGGIVKLIFTKLTADNAPVSATTLTFDKPTGGTGFVFGAIFTTNGIEFQTFTGTISDAARGSGYKFGDKITVDTTQDGLTLAADKRAVFGIRSIYMGTGQPSIFNFMDAGYNYERVPIVRWAHTYDLNTAFSYGSNLGARTFQSEGNLIGVKDTSAHQINDPCLSAGALIMNKEDEFVPGIFHETKQNTNFKLNAPVLFFPTTGGTNFTLTPNFPTGWKLTVPNTPTTFNGNSVNQNPLNSMPLGAIYQSYIEPNLVHLPTSTDQQKKDLAINLGNIWSSLLKITSKTSTQSETIVVFNGVENYVGSVSKILTGNPTAGFTLPAGDHVVQLSFNSAEDGGAAPTTAPQLTITIDGTGNLTNATIFDGGTGNREGMTYNIQGQPTLTKFYSLQVDNQAGWNFSANRSQSLTNANLILTSSGTFPVNLFIVPVQAYDDSTIGDRFVYRLEGATPTIAGNFPVSLNESKLDSLRFNDPNVSNGKVSNGLYRNAGLENSADPEFDTYRGVYVNHDSGNQFEVVSTTGTLVDQTVSFGTTGTEVIQPFGTGTDLWYNNAGVPTLRLHIASFNALNIPLPEYRYIVLKSGVHETHIETGGLMDFDATFYYIRILSTSTHYNTRTTSDMSIAAQTYIGRASTVISASVSNTNDNLNGKGITNIQILYAQEVKYFNTQVELTWGTGATGSLGITSQQNFYGVNDGLYNYIMETGTPIGRNTTDLIRQSYNQGGYYYLSTFFGLMSTKDGTSYDYDLTYNAFNTSGYDNFLLGELPAQMYIWRNDYQLASTLNYNQSYTDITTNWDYYPLYRQKTITINKDFCVATDISGIWNNSAHALTGAINPTDGTEYVSKENSGILQNEFIMPVFGANNIIDDTGEYIKDTVLYSQSGGLEPGHSKGIAYLQYDNNWLSGNIMYHLPEDSRGMKYYNVYFRTAFTKIRNYDPLKTTGTGAGLNLFQADRTPLKTVNLTADKIGNANANGSTTKKALDGATMLALNAAAPHPSAYELGEAGGVPATGGTPVRFGAQSFYPIYYLDKDKISEYPKAKISNFVGSSEVALVFDSGTSAFGFQFLHQPFTSEFIDGQGGVQSVRVFFGNRREGVLNHDSVGGLLVVNYARPDYPRNTFSRVEVSDNQPTGDYFPNGIDPLKSSSLVGRTFMNKLGFSDTDIGLVANGKIDPNNTKLNYVIQANTKQLDSLTDGPPNLAPGSLTITTAITSFYGTTGTDIDTSDSILSEIPAPETNAGLESHNQIELPFNGRSRKILRQFGDLIFYPYGINTNTNSFSDTTSIVRYDNCTSSFGTVGGLLLSNSSRSMGLPNVLGSLSSVDDSTIPVQLNPDCLIYTSYTVACGSSLKQASSLPIKFKHGYLLVLSSLIKEANIYMSKIGFVNAMSIINKTFLTGDFILSQGELQFYAQEDFVLSEITTSIKNSNFSNPSTLGRNSSVIYSITDYQPVSDKEPLTVQQEQQEDIQIAQMVNEHINYNHGGNPSGLHMLQKDFYTLGLDILTRQTGDVVQAVRNQINTHDLPNLSLRERSAFLQTPEGQVLLQNATDIQMIRSHTDDITDINVDDTISDSVAEARKRSAEREIRERYSNIIARTPEFYFQKPELEDEPDLPPTPRMTFEDLQKIEQLKRIPEKDRGMASLAFIESLPPDQREQARRTLGKRLREPETERYRSRKADMIFDTPYEKQQADNIIDMSNNRLEVARNQFKGEDLEEKEKEILNDKKNMLEEIQIGSYKTLNRLKRSGEKPPKK